MTSISTGSCDGAGQVAHEDEGALEHPDQQRRSALVVGGELLAQLGHPLGENILGDDHLAESRRRYPRATGHAASPAAPGCHAAFGRRPSVIDRRRYLTAPGGDRGHRQTGPPTAPDPHAPGPRRWRRGCPGPRPGPVRPRPDRRRMGAVAPQPAAGWPAGPGARGAAPERRASAGSMPPARSSSRSASVAEHRRLAGQHGHDVAARRCPSTRGGARGGPGCARSGVVVGGILHRLEARAVGTGPGSRTGAAPRRGWTGPGRMAARPSRPAPRSRLSSTVSAWSSMVWPVAAPGARTARRAARARASRFGPGSTGDAFGP